MQVQAKCKYYVDKNGALRPYELCAFSVPVHSKSNKCSLFRIVDAEPDALSEIDSSSSQSAARDYAIESRRRAISKCRDLGTCNPDLSLFVTLTLDQTRVDRYDYDQIIGSMNDWLSNRVKRKGLKYLIVPELHKDGAIHFHGLFNDVLARTNSGVRHHGKVVYNLPEWSLGFTTAQRITGDDCARKVTEYVLKYMTKSPEKIGGRFYLHGGVFDKPTVLWYNGIEWDNIPTPAYEVFDGLSVRVCRNELTISELLQSSGELLP